MKKLFQSSIMAGIAVVALALLCSSFVMRRGGDSYTISVNGKQVAKYYVASKETLPSVTIGSSDDQIEVYYSECGKIGTSRMLSILNDKNQKLREWTFANALYEHTPMTISFKEVKSTQKMELYYSSALVSTHRKLANLVMKQSSQTASR
jgi:hypothetical protein